MRCDTMRCDAGVMVRDLDEGEAGCVTGQVLTNFLAGEEEQPFEGQFNLDFNLPFDTVDKTLLNTFLRPDRRHHARVCEDIVIRPRTHWKGR